MTGAVGGPAVELARELARRRGVEVQLIGVQTPQNVIDAVQNGDADIGFVAYNPERAGPIEFSQPFMLVLQTFVVRGIRRAVRQGYRSAESEDWRTKGGLDGPVSGSHAEAGPARRNYRDHGNRGHPRCAERAVGRLRTNRQRLTEALRNTPGLRLLKDDLYGVEQTIVVPKGDEENLKAVDRLIDDIRISGFLRERSNRAASSESRSRRPPRRSAKPTTSRRAPVYTGSLLRHRCASARFRSAPLSAPP